MSTRQNANMERECGQNDLEGNPRGKRRRSDEDNMDLSDLGSPHSTRSIGGPAIHDDARSTGHRTSVYSASGSTGDTYSQCDTQPSTSAFTPSQFTPGETTAHTLTVPANVLRALSTTPEDSSMMSASGGQSNPGSDPGSKKRRHHSKSRRGCANCKKRRVKCDETHPKCHNCEHMGLECSFLESTKPGSTDAADKPTHTTADTSDPRSDAMNIARQLYLDSRGASAIDMVGIKGFYHYTTVVWRSITAAGISNDQIWGTDVPQLAFEYPYLMHAILTFSSTHLSQIDTDQARAKVFEAAVTVHRGEALRLLREAVQQVNAENIDALVAAAILMILDSFANASLPDETSPKSLPASAWLHHVRGAATILLAVGPLPPSSRFFQLVNIDLRDLADTRVDPFPVSAVEGVSPLKCFDDDLKDLYPVPTNSPYFQTLVYIDKLFHQRYKPDFILRVFSFPALLDRNLLGMLASGDTMAKRIIKFYYKLVRSFTAEMKDKVWFLEGVARVLPIDMDSELGGLGFITNALPVSVTLDNILRTFDDSILAANQERLRMELLGGMSQNKK